MKVDDVHTIDRVDTVNRKRKLVFQRKGNVGGKQKRHLTDFANRKLIESSLGMILKTGSLGSSGPQLGPARHILRI